jgi:diketogulonate reductase-like aldo/keto reductase
MKTAAVKSRVMKTSGTKTVALPSGERVPALGMGTWRMGESRAAAAEEMATLRLGLDLGAALIDTAEMYGEGRAETLIGRAIAGRREEVFLVSKVYPHNASRADALSACERSLRRLATDHIDLYLLHWRGAVPLDETLEAFVTLQQAGKIRYYGVSNFDVADMEELWSLSPGRAVVTDQVLYNLGRRGLEHELQPWLQTRHLPIMAYSPFEEGRLLSDARLALLAGRYGRTPAQMALAWLLARDGVIAIPKTANRQRLRENLQAIEHPLTAEELAALDESFPRPRERQPLEML